jgi:hypothetical protein
MKLPKMPFVEGLPSFVNALNKLTKGEPKRSGGFKVFAEINQTDQIAEFEVFPEADK